MTVQMVGLNCLYINITFYIPLEFYVDEHITLMTCVCEESGDSLSRSSPARWLPFLA